MHKLLSELFKFRALVNKLEFAFKIFKENIYRMYKILSNNEMN